MNTIRCLLFFAATLTAWPVFAANATPGNSNGANSQPKPPAFTVVPDTASKPVDPQSPKIDPVARGMVQIAHDRWAKRTGLGLNPILSFAGGHPVLLVVTDSNEPAGARRHLEEAVIEACQFLVNDKTFDTATVSVARVNSKNPKATKVENVIVRREAFQQAIKTAGKSEKFAASTAKLRGNDAGIHQAYLALGFK